MKTPIPSKSSFLLLLITTSIAHAATLLAPSGKFTFEGKPYIGTATLINTLTTNRSLYLNGVYDESLGKPGKAVFRPTVFDYRRFTVVVKMRPDNIAKKTLFVGGTSFRWFAIEAGKQGQVELSFNNFRFRHQVDNLVITNGHWITLALSFDLESKKAVVYADGTRADELALPQNFGLDIIDDNTFRESDKVLTFTDYAGGNAFEGLVASIIIFDAILSEDQVRLLFPKH